MPQTALDRPFAEDDEEEPDEEPILACDPASAPPTPAPRACRVCGCTDERCCEDDQGKPCYWVAFDLIEARAAQEISR